MHVHTPARIIVQSSHHSFLAIMNLEHSRKIINVTITERSTVAAFFISLLREGIG